MLEVRKTESREVRKLVCRAERPRIVVSVKKSGSQVRKSGSPKVAGRIERPGDCSKIHRVHSSGLHVFPSLELSVFPTFRLLVFFPSSRLSVFPTFGLSVFPTFALFDFRSFRLSVFPTFGLPHFTLKSIPVHPLIRGYHPVSDQSIYYRDQSRLYQAYPPQQIQADVLRV